jgi:hypothetical protein
LAGAKQVYKCKIYIYKDDLISVKIKVKLWIEGKGGVAFFFLEEDRSKGIRSPAAGLNFHG